MNRHFKFFITGIAFILLMGVGISVLIGLLITHFPPEQRMGTPPMMQGQQQQRQRSMWQRLVDAWNWQRREAQRLPSQRPGQQQVQSDVTGVSPGGGQSGINGPQLVMRETSLAEQFLNNGHGRDQEDSLHTLKRLPIETTAGTQYELTRYQAIRAFETYFEPPTEQRDPQKLAEAYQLNKQVANAPEANFEDYFHFSVMALWMGKPDEALEWATKAEAAWPLKQGRGYGYVYFVILLSHAAKNNTAEVLDLMPQFTTHFPDWLYVETYVPDIDDTIQNYPDAPLPYLIRGRSLQRVLDFKSAEDDYQRALASPKLRPAGRAQIRTWTQEMERARTP